MVTGEANFRVREDVRITNIKVLSQTEDGYETNSAEYYKDGIKVMATLSKLESTITYEVEITNDTDMDYYLKSKSDIIASNSSMKYTMVGLDLDSTVITKNSKTTFTIVVEYQQGVSLPSDNTATFEIRYVFDILDVTPPIVAFEPSGGEYNEFQTVTVSAYDDHYDHMDIEVHNSQGMIQSQTNIKNSTYQVSLDSYDTYTIYVKAYDQRGNVQNTEPRDSRGYTYQQYEIKKPAPVNLVKYLKSLANPESIATYAEGTTTEMYTFSHDETEQTGALTDYRYIGETPNNYVYFNCTSEPQSSSNCETWRIIGVFPVENENGDIEERVKIIKNTLIYSKAWDENHVNNWETATLNTYLNGTYYDGLSDTAKAMIKNTKYYLGGSDQWQNLGGPDCYKFERGTTVYRDRPTYWIGKIGLMYPSDYVYTYALGVNDTCYNDGSKCPTYQGGTPSAGWLFSRYYNQGTLSPYSGYSGMAFVVKSSGEVEGGYSDGYNVQNLMNFRPTLYLTPDIMKVDGDGSSGNPYQLKLPTMAEALKAKANDESVGTYEEGTKEEMYTFKHEATEQTDELTDYRYIGNTPNNYVYFNCTSETQSSSTCETWRIIGIFPVDDGKGNIEERMKIIRDASIGDKAWNSGGNNNWQSASLMTYLNGIYLNSLSSIAQAMIGTTKYYLGGSSTYQNLGGPDYYNFERGNKVYGSNPKYWVGKIGLMYPSDYVYTYALGVNSTCYNDGYNCGTGTPSAGWLFKGVWEWTLAPSSANSSNAFGVSSSRYVSSGGIIASIGGVRPVLYLASIVSIVDGNGSSGNPYQLA